MVSIFSLPPEILLRIFQEYLHETIEDHIVEEKPNGTNLHHADGGKAPHWRWLVLMQVCRAWRTVVLSSPLLWSRLYPTLCEYPTIIDTFLSRSCKVPLSVYLKCYTETVIATLDRIQQSVSRLLQEDTRLRYLSFISSRLGFEHSFSPLATEASLTLLESLEIQIYDDDAHAWPLEGLPIILQADFRCLHNVVLGDIFPEWPLFRNLPSTITSLCIVNEYQPELVDGTMDDVFALLKKLVQLKKLRLVNCLPFLASGAMDAICMTDLQEFEVTGPASSTISLFESLELSPDTIIILSLQTHREQDVLGDCSSVFSHLRGIYKDNKPLTSAGIWVEGAKVTFILYEVIVIRFQLELVLKERNGEDALFRPLTILRDMIDGATAKTLSPLVSLWISVQGSDAHDTAGALTHVFQAINNLWTVAADKTGTDVLRPHKDTPILLPRLVNLLLCGVNIVDEQPLSGNSMNADLFCRCLEERKACGYGLRLLEFRHDCEIRVPDPDGLRDRIKEVVGYLGGWGG